MSKAISSRIERIISDDPGGRRTAGMSQIVNLCSRALFSSAKELATNAKHIGIVTGFAVQSENRTTAETDGPLGSLALAAILSHLGIPCTFITDALCANILRLTAADLLLDVPTIEFPYEPDPRDRHTNKPSQSQFSFQFADRLLAEPPSNLPPISHLISIERAGPSHHEGSIASESEFEEYCKFADIQNHNQVHSMRARIITEHTAKIHILFEVSRSHGVKTIGIGDGGNEIGMGSLPWLIIHSEIANGHGATVACRVQTDWSIYAGVSNWGAYGIAALIALYRSQHDLTSVWNEQHEARALKRMLELGAVDGITGKNTASVDDLPLNTHLAVWQKIHAAIQSA